MSPRCYIFRHKSSLLASFLNRSGFLPLVTFLLLPDDTKISQAMHGQGPAAAAPVAGAPQKESFINQGIDEAQRRLNLDAGQNFMIDQAQHQYMGQRQQTPGEMIGVRRATVKQTFTEKFFFTFNPARTHFWWIFTH